MSMRGLVQAVGSLARRGVALLALLALVVMASMPLATVGAADDPAVQFVQRMTRDLIDANRRNSVLAFSESIKRHANVTAIGNYALGAYQSKLPAGDREGYLAGMVRFISRYAATESQKYQVSHVQIMGPA